MGLKEQEIIQLINENEETLKRLSFPKSNISSTTNLIMSKFRFDLKMTENQLIYNLYLLSGGPIIGHYYGILPIILPSQNIVKRGERFKADIGIVPYDYEFLAEDMKLTVNGKPVPFDKGRFASFVSEPITTSSEIIKISLKVKDRRINKFIPAWDNYEYKIQTEE